MAGSFPEFPLESLRAAAGDDASAHTALGDFHSAIGSDAPNAADIARHAERVRAVPPLVGAFERWWLDPRVQAFIAELNATGI